MHTIDRIKGWKNLADRLRNQLEQALLKNKDLEDQLQTQKQKIKTLETQNKTLNSTIKKLERELNKLKTSKAQDDKRTEN